MLSLLINEILCALEISNIHLFTWFNKGKWTIVVQPCPQTIQNITLAPHDFVESFYLILFVNIKATENNLCDTMYFP